MKLPKFVLADRISLDECCRLQSEQGENAEIIAGNFCRCSGYKRIEDAILDAAGRGSDS